MRLRTVILAASIGTSSAPAVAQTVAESLRIDPPPGPTLMPGSFGRSVTLGENGVLAVGAPSDTTGGTTTGGVYLFDQATGAQLLAFKPTTTATLALCGWSVAIDDGIVVTGSVFESDMGVATDSIYIFEAATGTQLHRITAPAAAPLTFFGLSVAIDQGTIVAGAFDEADGGAAYVFDAVSGAQLYRVAQTGTPTTDRFGISVAIDTDYVVVGSTSQDNTIPGETYVFDRASGAHLTTLTSPIANSFFGQSVAVSDDGIFVGAPTTPSGPVDSIGAVYKYDRNTFALVDTLTPFTANVIRFGNAISARDGLLVVGANEDDNNGNEAGAAFLYSAATGALLARLEPGASAADENFGSAVSTRDNIAVVTKLETPTDSNNGASYIYRAPFVCGPADTNGDGILNNTDINLFITLFMAQDPVADLNLDGAFTNTDINIFVNAFLTGCD